MEVAKGDGGGCLQAAAGDKSPYTGFDVFLQTLSSHLMRVSRAAPSDQQMKELLQEVTRLQAFGNFICILLQTEEGQIELRSESVKVANILEGNKVFY